MVFPPQGLHLLRVLLCDSFFRKLGPDILDAENGLAERILFIDQKPISKDLAEMAQLCEKLNDFPVSLKVVLEQVHAEHNNDMSIK